MSREYGLAEYGKNYSENVNTPEDCSEYGIAKFGKSEFGCDNPERLPAMLWPPAWTVRGKLGRPEDAPYDNVSGIWQMRMTKTGKRPIRMRFYEYNITRTPAQQVNRNKFRDGMAEWTALDDSKKAEYDKRAKKQKMFGRNLFIKEYLLKN